LLKCSQETKATQLKICKNNGSHKGKKNEHVVSLDKLDSHDQLQTMVVKPRISHNVIITSHSQHMQNDPISDNPYQMISKNFMNICLILFITKVIGQ
jgi:hypothetical protein